METLLWVYLTGVFATFGPTVNGMNILENELKLQRTPFWVLCVSALVASVFWPLTATFTFAGALYKIVRSWFG